ncbi:MAG: multidrug ABC transporter ATP-binding protein [Flavobacteriales bacterium]|nr:multidrug ABC transporter ATP-binding protein [Flavobacteriales bacterium]|tara:strand:+ start:2439 stop:4181 length:1743 start_codon:yes stop_codon:yes gene_type:complete
MTKNKNTSLKHAGRLFQYLKPYRIEFSFGLFFLLLSTVASLIFPALMGNLVDSASDKLVNNINQIAIALLVLFALQAIFSYFRIVLFVNVTEKTLAVIRQETYAHLIKLPMNFFSKRRVGELNSRIASDISLLQETFTTDLAEFLRQVLIIIGGIVFLSLTSVELTLFMLAIIPAMMLAAVFFGRYIKQFSKQVQEKVAESNTIIEETLQGISNVKAFTNEFFEIKRYTKKTNEVMQIAKKGGRYRGAFASFIIFCLFGSIVAVIWYGVLMINSNELSIGELFTFILYSVFIGASVGGMADIYAKLQKAIGATEHLMDILEEEKEEIHSTFSTDAVEGHIKFHNLSFTYPSRPDVKVLNNLNFEIEYGHNIALVGPSGAGKTTLASILFGFYKIEEGQISIDGKNIEEYDLHFLRKQIAVVPQDILLFGGSIKENIAYGKLDASEQEIKEAAKKANALNFINDFPEKMETLVGERGIQLSGGQRQRIAIARAILKNPSILILDEATSALDSESEKLIQEAMEELMKGRTSIVIAHRLSTIKNADRILVLENGQIIDQGTHQELQKNEGLYKQLSDLQFNH